MSRPAPNAAQAPRVPAGTATRKAATGPKSQPAVKVSTASGTAVSAAGT